MGRARHCWPSARAGQSVPVSIPWVVLGLWPDPQPEPPWEFRRWICWRVAGGPTSAGDTLAPSAPADRAAGHETRMATAGLCVTQRPSCGKIPCKAEAGKPPKVKAMEMTR